jgi:hypothetical protein
MIYSEEIETIEVGRGLFTDEYPSNIPDGFLADARNIVPLGNYVESRRGFDQTTNAFTNYVESHNYVTGRLFTLSPIVASDSGDQINQIAVAVCLNNRLHLLRSHDPVGAGGFVNDEYASGLPGASGPYYVAQYGDRIYYTSSTGVDRINAVNWTAHTFTNVNVLSDTSLIGLFTYKDRMWAWSNNALYFTDVATFGGYPETWNLASQNVVFNSPGGNTRIVEVIPLGNRLVVFTTRGIHTVLVEGVPASWIVRPLDLECVANQACGFSYGNLIYFADQRGVHVTNGLTVTKVSNAIENYFQVTQNPADTKDYAYLCTELDRGMVVSIVSSSVGGADSDECYVFYSKIDNIAWSRWDFQNHHGESSEIYDLIAIRSTTPRIKSLEYSSLEVQFALVSVGLDSNGIVVTQLRAYNGSVDDIQYSNSGLQLETKPVEGKIKTRFTDGAFPIKRKRFKQAFLHAYSQVTHQFKYRWIADNGLEVSETTLTKTPTGSKYNQLALKADFQHRETAFDVAFTCLSSNWPVQIKNIAVLRHTERTETREV